MKKLLLGLAVCGLFSVATPAAKASDQFQLLGTATTNQAPVQNVYWRRGWGGYGGYYRPYYGGYYGYRPYYGGYYGYRPYWGGYGGYGGYYGYGPGFGIGFY